MQKEKLFLKESIILAHSVWHLDILVLKGPWMGNWVDEAIWGASSNSSVNCELTCDG